MNDLGRLNGINHLEISKDEYSFLVDVLKKGNDYELWQKSLNILYSIQLNDFNEILISLVKKDNLRFFLEFTEKHYYYFNYSKKQVNRRCYRRK